MVVFSPRRIDEYDTEATGHPEILLIVWSVLGNEHLISPSASEYQTNVCVERDQVKSQQMRQITAPLTQQSLNRQP